MIEVAKSPNGRIELYGKSLIDAAFEKITKPTHSFTMKIAHLGIGTIALGMGITSSENFPTISLPPEPVRIKLTSVETSLERSLAGFAVSMAGVALVSTGLGLDLVRENQQRANRRKLTTS